MVADPEELRARSRSGWEGAAAGWTRAREAFQRDAEPVSRRMLDFLEPGPGQTVLELAAGPGDTGFLALADLEPGGRLISTDGADAMVAAARARAEELDVAELVEVRQMEAEWIDLPTASVDGVLCRWGYMLLADPEAALRETRRVLRPGGKVVLACWADAEANPWSTGKLLVRLGFVEPTDPLEPGPFRLADPDELRELLRAAGFDDVELEEVAFAFRAADADAWWEQQLDCSLSLRAFAAALAPARHHELRDAVDEALSAYAVEDCSLRLPARTWVAVATA